MTRIVCALSALGWIVIAIIMFLSAQGPADQPYGYSALVLALLAGGLALFTIWRATTVCMIACFRYPRGPAIRSWLDSWSSYGEQSESVSL
jgi:hypothetical protein